MPIFPSWIYMGGETREEGRELEREGKGGRRENGRRGKRQDKGEGGGMKITIGMICKSQRLSIEF